MPHPVRNYGQVFTPGPLARRLISWIRNRGKILEPACGDGAFLRNLPRAATALEIQQGIAPPGAYPVDFFSWPKKADYATIIGNPPFVRHGDILPATKKLLPLQDFPGRPNLCWFFIARALDLLKPGGELLFITPVSFTKATSAAPVNERLFSEGGFTHFEVLPANAFPGFSPECALWRWEKGRKARSLEDGRRFEMQNGQIWFRSPNGPKTGPGRIGDYFTIRTGAASGADALFTHPRGNAEFACSKTRKTGETRRMFYNQRDRALLPHKKQLLARKIRRFGPDNWWEWGRNHLDTPMPRLYVNCITRDPEPFFLHPALHWDGSLLALFPKKPLDLQAAADVLNAAGWESLGFRSHGRTRFTQRGLTHAPAPAGLSRVPCKKGQDAALFNP